MKVDEIKAKLHLEVLGREIQRIVREGHPSVGWRGNPWLTVAHNKILDCFEVWDETPGEPPMVVIRSKRGSASKRSIDIIGLARMLAEGDLRFKDMRTRMREIEQHNEAVDRAKEQAHTEAKNEATQRVLHGLMKDVGHLY